jgi:hypothetical protein
MWSAINTGLPDYANRGFNCLVSDAENLYACYAFPWSGGIGVYKTSLSSISWSPSNSGLVQTIVNALAIDSNNHVYAASGLSGPFNLQDNTWNNMLGDPSNPPLNPIDTPLVIVGADENSLYITNGNADTVFHWNGTTWETVDSITVGPSSWAIDDNNLYIGTNNGLYQWNGTTLSALIEGTRHLNITSLAIDTSVSPHILYAGVGLGSIGARGIYTLTLDDSLSDFTLISATENYSINDLTLYEPANSTPIVFASIFLPGSPDVFGVWTWDGSNWNDIPSLSGIEINSLAVDSIGTLYSSGQQDVSDVINYGIYVTPYNKNSYFVTDNFFNSEVLDIAIDSHNKVYAATSGSGVYALQ